MFLVRHLNVEDVRPVVIDHLFECGHEVRLVANGGRRNSVAFGNGDKIGVAIFSIISISIASRLGMMGRAKVSVRLDCL